MLARAVDSAIVAARAPWSVKCSVVMNVTADARGSPLGPAESLSVPVATTPHESQTCVVGLLDERNFELQGRAANPSPSEWTRREGARLLIDAATLAEIGV